MTRTWQLTPLVLIPLFISAIIWLAFQWSKTFSFSQSRYTTAILGLGFAFGVITGTASVFQSFYWTSGAITYAGPFIVFLFHIGFLLYLHRQPSLPLWYSIFIALLMLLSGGFSPLVGIFQIAFFAILFILVWIFGSSSKKQHDLKLVGLSLLFITIAFLIVFVAPGNSVRQADFDNPLTFSQVIIVTIIESFRFLATALSFLSPLAVIVPLLLSGLVAFQYHPLSTAETSKFSKYTLQLLGISTIIGFALIASSFFTTLYSIGQSPPPRAYVVMQISLILTSMTWGYLMGLGLRRRYHPEGISMRTGILLVIIVAGASVLAIARPISLMPTFHEFAQVWDEQDTFLNSLEPNQPPIEMENFTQGLASYYWLIYPNLPCIQRYYEQPNIIFPESEPQWLR